MEIHQCTPSPSPPLSVNHGFTPPPALGGGLFNKLPGYWVSSFENFGEIWKFIATHRRWSAISRGARGGRGEGKHTLIFREVQHSSNFLSFDSSSAATSFHLSTSFSTRTLEECKYKFRIFDRFIITRIYFLIRPILDMCLSTSKAQAVLVYQLYYQPLQAI